MDTKVNVELSEDSESHSHAEINEALTSADARVSNSLSMNTHADAEEGEVWLAMRIHAYGNLDWREPSLSRGISILEHRFSRVEAECLVEILRHELKKFKELDSYDAEMRADEKVERMFH